MAGAMKSGPTSFGRSSRNQDLRRGTDTATAVIGAAPASLADLTPLLVEIAQLRFAHRELVPRAGVNALERHMRGQLRRHLALCHSSLQPAIEDPLRAEVLHAVDAEGHLHDGAAVEQLPRQKGLGAEPQGATVALDQVHGWRA